MRIHRYVWLGALAFITAIAVACGNMANSGDTSPGDAAPSDASNHTDTAMGTGDARTAVDVTSRPDAVTPPSDAAVRDTSSPMCTSAASAMAIDAVGGTGSPSNPYVLCTAAQLVTLSTTSSAWKFSFIMGADINLNNVPFTPIGNSTTPYHGTFDGAGHIVSNLQVSQASSNDVGFFGAMVGPAAEVRSLAIQSANVDGSGSGSVGILVGLLDRGRVINCWSDGTVTGGDDVGGLVGNGSSACVISTSHSSATVMGMGFRTGGLVGNTQQGAFVANSYATGSVTGGHDSIGGLMGTTHASIIVNSYATGDVSSTESDADEIGGLIGSSCSFVQLSLASGNVTASSSQSQNVDRFIGSWPCGYAESENDYEFTGSTCQSAHGACATPTESNPIGVASLSALQSRSNQPIASWDFQDVWTPSTNGFPTVTAPTLWAAPSWDGCDAHSTDPHSGGGNGTPEQPHLICTQTQFTSLGGDNPWWSTVTGPQGFTPVEYILQMADIDFMGGSVQPIGTDNNNFFGVYDGNGKKLANYVIQSSANSVGLIGEAQFSHVTRVAAVNGTVTATGDGLAALILASDFGEINDCYATGTVHGTSNVGGVSGGTHTIVDCYSAATVMATGGAGGIDGTGGSDIDVDHCFTASNVSGSNADAIVAYGHNGSANDCFYDSSKTCANCNDASGAMAISMAGYFFNTGNAPLTQWDFDNVWVAVPEGYPVLQ